jgi:hypothetical protein
LHRIPLFRSLPEHRLQFECIVKRDTQSCLKDASFVSAAEMRGTQTVVSQPCYFDYSVFGIPKFPLNSTKFMLI